MRTVSLRDTILWPAYSRMGYDPTVDLLKDVADASARYINAWVRKCWDVADWPELSRLEPRAPVNHLVPYDAGVVAPPNYSAAATYNKDSVVRDPNTSTNVYISVANANTGHPLIDPNWWALVAAWNPTVTYLAGNNTTPSATVGSLVTDPTSGIVYVAQTAIIPGSVLAASLKNPLAWLPVYSQQQPVPTITNIGKILKVYAVDPTLYDGPFDIPFWELDTTFRVGFRHGPNVWVKFMTRPNQYTLTPWLSTTTYQQYSVTGAITDLVYNATLGECFASAQAGNTNHALPTATVNNAFWNWVPVPFVIAEPVWRGLYSEMLRDEGQTAKAQAEEQGAMSELQLAIERNVMTRYDKITDQQTGTPRYNAMVSTGAA